MNNQLTTVEKFRRSVEQIKKSIIFYSKEINKLMKDIKRANGENDLKAIKEKLKQNRINLERYRLVLDDLTYAFVSEKNPSITEKIYKHFGYKTAEGFLTDRRDFGRPRLNQIIDLIAKRNYDIPSFYKIEYNEFGQLVVKRDSRYLRKGVEVIPIEQQRELFNAVNSAMRHK